VKGNPGAEGTFETPVEDSFLFQMEVAEGRPELEARIALPLREFEIAHFVHRGYVDAESFRQSREPRPSTCHVRVRCAK
jgi:hypothetical protein